MPYEELLWPATGARASATTLGGRRDNEGLYKLSVRELVPGRERPVAGRGIGSDSRRCATDYLTPETFRLYHELFQLLSVRLRPPAEVSSVIAGRALHDRSSDF